MRLLIVEDHPALARALGVLLMSHADIAVVGVATDEPSAREAHEREHPDVVLCDVMLHGRDAGFDLLRAFGQASRFLMYSAYDVPAHHARALNEGAAGFVSKTADTEEIIAALREVAQGGRWFPPGVLRSAARALPPPTPRERQLLHLLLDHGATNEEIAQSLGLRVKSVESMFRRMFDRYRLDNRTQLAQLATREGWVAPGPPGPA